MRPKHNKCIRIAHNITKINKTISMEMHTWWKSITLLRRPFLSPCFSVLTIKDDEGVQENCEHKPREKRDLSMKCFAASLNVDRSNSWSTANRSALTEDINFFGRNCPINPSHLKCKVQIIEKLLKNKPSVIIKNCHKVERILQLSRSIALSLTGMHLLARNQQFSWS